MIARLEVRRRVDAVIREVADRYELRPGDLTSSSYGDRSVQLARHLAVYIAREETGASYPALGRVFGRDHTTVLHSCRLVRDQLAADAEVAREVRAIRDALNGRALVTAPSRENGAHGASGRAVRSDLEERLAVTPRRLFGSWCGECGVDTAVDDDDLCEACATGAGAVALPLLVACECPCGRRVHGARPVLQKAAIRCGQCGGDFLLRQQMEAIRKQLGEGDEVTGRDRNVPGTGAVRPRQDREAQRRRLGEILAVVREVGAERGLLAAPQAAGGAEVGAAGPCPWTSGCGVDEQGLHRCECGCSVCGAHSDWGPCHCGCLLCAGPDGLCVGEYRRVSETHQRYGSAWRERP